MPRPDRLPPMQALLMFESAARHASFTAAARELGSTQPAVSQRVVQLEESLGAALFERGHRGVTLTDDGTRLFDAVRRGLDVIRAATSDIRSRHAQRTLTLSTDFGFATYWLMPRLPQFKALMPDVDGRSSRRRACRAHRAIMPMWSSSSATRMPNGAVRAP